MKNERAYVQTYKPQETVCFQLGNKIGKKAPLFSVFRIVSKSPSPLSGLSSLCVAGRGFAYIIKGGLECWRDFSTTNKKLGLLCTYSILYSCFHTTREVTPAKQQDLDRSRSKTTQKITRHLSYIYCALGRQLWAKSIILFLKR